MKRFVVSLCKFRIPSIIFIVVFSFFIPLVNNTVDALSGSDFKAGRIIDDSIFVNSNAMNVVQIQQFLNAKMPNCETWHSAYNSDNPPPYTCLKDYQENPTNGDNNFGRYAGSSPYQVPGGKSAAQIIWEAGQTYSINPQVLIVLLQKEQGLVTDTWPLRSQYTKAMGYLCPDTAPCSASAGGFYKQVFGAAWQFRHDFNGIDSAGYWSPYGKGWNNVLYNPSASCGTRSVYIENQATAVLYKYTPYTPNDSALAVMNDSTPGGTVTCGAYGNRNFFWYFNKWFGSTLSNCAMYSSSAYGLYRLYNKNTGGTLITIDGCEAKAATNIGYMLDGQLFQGAASGIPIYRLEKKGGYLYTSSIGEANSAVSNYGYRLEGMAFYGVDPALSPEIAKPVFRLVNSSGGYLYTISEHERNKFISEGYRFEGVGYYAQENGGNEVVSTYRLAHPNGIYLYTMYPSERDAAAIYYGYRIEGVGFKAITQLNTYSLPIYRLANSKAYLYTTSLKERAYATSIGYRDEGIAMYTYGNQADPNLPTLYRLVGKSGGYLYTSSQNEINSAVNSYGYKLEGLAFRTP